MHSTGFPTHTRRHRFWRMGISNDLSCRSQLSSRLFWPRIRCSSRPGWRDFAPNSVSSECRRPNLFGCNTRRSFKLEKTMNRTTHAILGAMISVSFMSRSVSAANPCDTIVIANKATMQSEYTTTDKSTGVPITPYMSKIHMHYTEQSCKLVREDSINGEAVAVYTQHMVAPEGSTDEELWISRQSNRILREEIDGEITGQGHGHLSVLYHF